MTTGKVTNLRENTTQSVELTRRGCGAVAAPP